jgi:3-oxoadipate enol-lactonase
MPFTTADDGVRLYYELFGRRDGDPVLLIHGLGTDSRGWVLQRAAVGARFRGIVFDNRGVGRSDKPPGPYSLHRMAEDACRVLDAAGYESAHVVGASMGGVIAQIMAVTHPDRVRSLVLACTSCRHHPWRRRLMHEWIDVAERDGMSAFGVKNVGWLVGHSMLRVPAVVRLLVPFAITAPPHAFIAQTNAILDVDDHLRRSLPGVRVPTLVLVGSRDILTPVADAEELAELIPDANLVVIGGAAHGFMVEAFRSFNAPLVSFLAAVAEGAAAGGAGGRSRGVRPTVERMAGGVASLPSSAASSIASLFRR